MHRDQPGQDASNSTNRPPFHENAAGKARTIRWHDQGWPLGRPCRGPKPRARRPAIRAGRRAHPRAILSAASTEVVMAETEFCVPSLAVRLTGVALVPLGVVSATFSTLIPVALGLRPRDVTGIQRAQVLGHRRLVQFVFRFLHGADAPWLDCCDKHRNEGRPIDLCPNMVAAG